MAEKSKLSINLAKYIINSLHFNLNDKRFEIQYKKTKKLLYSAKDYSNIFETSKRKN